jgi:DnaJ-class molecular chaperone
MSYNPYAILGAYCSQSDAEIRTAFMKRMREAHPDRGGDQDTAAALNAAYALVRTLGDRARIVVEQELRGWKLCEKCNGRGGRVKKVYGEKQPCICGVCGGAGRVPK